MLSSRHSKQRGADSRPRTMRASWTSRVSVLPNTVPSIHTGGNPFRAIDTLGTPLRSSTPPMLVATASKSAQAAGRPASPGVGAWGASRPRPRHTRRRMFLRDLRWGLSGGGSSNSTSPTEAKIMVSPTASPVRVAVNSTIPCTVAVAYFCINLTLPPGSNTTATCPVSAHSRRASPGTATITACLDRLAATPTRGAVWRVAAAITPARSSTPSTERTGRGTRNHLSFPTGSAARILRARVPLPWRSTVTSATSEAKRTHLTESSGRSMSAWGSWCINHLTTLDPQLSGASTFGTPGSWTSHNSARTMASCLRIRTTRSPSCIPTGTTASQPFTQHPNLAKATASTTLKGTTASMGPRRHRGIRARGALWGTRPASPERMPSVTA
mmetsp:Transcript_113029/g.258920  ORF Transcript_113029/g.258920 Transcript_113029/m.258920 type:complete len:385 (+) Transcript_113029:619-1773(+)